MLTTVLVDTSISSTQGINVGGTALLSALVGGVVAFTVAVITHAFTRHREHQKWLRERLFDAVKSLRKHLIEIHQAVSTYPKFSNNYTSPSQIRRRIKAYDFTRLNIATSAYCNSLFEIYVLIPERDFAELIDSITETTNALSAILEQVTIPEDGFDPNTAALFDQKRNEAFNAYQEKHWELINILSDQYFSIRDKPVQQWVSKLIK